MIKTAGPLLAVLTAALALLSTPPALAHGAGAPREIDTRVLLDDDGALAYGGCVEGTCPAGADGLDLLALDVREAWLGDAPAIAFRMVYQTEGDAAGRGLTLAVTANGTEHELLAASQDGLSFAAAGFDRVDGPFDVFDGHPKAVDGWALLSTLGVAPGDELTGITLTSTAGDAPDDVMPGGWYSNGAEVPHVPHEPDPGEALAEQGPGTYAIKGPAPLVTIEATPALLDLNRSGNLTLKLSNPLAGIPQAVHISTPGTLGAFAGGSDAAAITIDPGATRVLTLTWPAAAPSGNATIVATTDLGGRAVGSVQVVAIPPVSMPGEPENTPSKGTPLPALAPLAAIALALALRRRP